MRSLLTPVLCLLAVAQIACAGTLVQFRTVFGDIQVELYDQDKPATVQNFLRYIESGSYENSFSHRLIPGFVVQGGGFAVTNRGTTNATIVPVPMFAPVTNEFGTGRRFSNVFGTIAMAKRGGDTNSASSQWFINLANNTSLDAADTNNLFVVFGHVIAGTNVLNTFNAFQRYTNTNQVNNVVFHQFYAAPFDDLPLLHPAFTEANLVFVDISLLQVAIQPAAGGHEEISWNSVAGKTNVVEYTTTMPPVWQQLVTTNGNGSRYAVTSSVGTNRFRFYRVRVDY